MAEQGVYCESNGSAPEYLCAFMMLAIKVKLHQFGKKKEILVDFIGKSTVKHFDQAMIWEKIMQKESILELGKIVKRVTPFPRDALFFELLQW